MNNYLGRARVRGATAPVSLAAAQHMIMYKYNGHIPKPIADMLDNKPGYNAMRAFILLRQKFPKAWLLKLLDANEVPGHRGYAFPMPAARHQQIKQWLQRS